jgi:hypothetical protein
MYRLVPLEYAYSIDLKDIFVASNVPPCQFFSYVNVVEKSTSVVYKLPIEMGCRPSVFFIYRVNRSKEKKIDEHCTIRLSFLYKYIKATSIDRPFILKLLESL